MGPVDSAWNWIINHPDRGGVEFISFVTAINVAQLGWSEFQKKFRYAEMKYKAMLDSALGNASYAKHKDFLKGFVRFFFSPVRIAVNVGWVCNFCLNVCMAFAGLGMLYLHASCVYDYLLLVPTVAYLALTYFALGILWIVLLIFGAIVNRVESERETEAFVKQAGEASGTDIKPEKEG
jgi:hypothetical protein